MFNKREKELDQQRLDREKEQQDRKIKFELELAVKTEAEAKLRTEEKRVYEEGITRILNSLSSVNLPYRGRIKSTDYRYILSRTNPEILLDLLSQLSQDVIYIEELLAERFPQLHLSHIKPKLREKSLKDQNIRPAMQVVNGVPLY